MKIIECQIDNFGKLSDIKFKFNEGLNIICQDNGFGKSTLAAFIRVMFYGFHNETKRNDIDNERLRYAPWNGGVYGGSISFTVGEKAYKAVRRFGTKDKKKDEFYVYDWDSLRESHDYSANLGEELLSIDDEAFMKTIFISQQDCSTNATSNISAKIGDLSMEADDISNYDQAYDVLTKKINNMSPDKKTGNIYKVKQELSFCEEEIRHFAGIYDEIYKTENAIESKSENLARLREEQELIIKGIGNNIISKPVDVMGRYGYICQQVEDLDRRFRLEASFFKQGLIKDKDIRFSISDIVDEQDINKASKLISKSHRNEIDKNVLKAGRPLLYIAIILILTGIGLLFIAKTIGIGLVAVGLVGLALYTSKSTKIKRNIQDMLAKKEEEDRYLDEFFEQFSFEQGISYEDKLIMVKERFKSCQQIEKEFKLSLENKKDFERQYNILDYNNTNDTIKDVALKDITRKIEMANNELSRLKNDLARLNIEVADYEKTVQLRDNLKDKLDRLTYSYNIYLNTREYLYKARDNFYANFRKPVKKAFDKYYSMLSGNDNSLYVMDADMKIMLVNGSKAESIKKLSEGYKDLIGICMRMAFSEAMFKDESPFYIFDDSFVNLDDKKLGCAMEFLERVSRENQVIYFTCHSNVLPTC